jgi:hypothetical protein
LGDFTHCSVTLPYDRKLLDRSAVKIAMADQAEAVCALVPYLEAPEIRALHLNDSVQKIFGRGPASPEYLDVDRCMTGCLAATQALATLRTATAQVVHVRDHPPHCLASA